MLPLSNSGYAHKRGHLIQSFVKSKHGTDPTDVGKRAKQVSIVEWADLSLRPRLAIPACLFQKYDWEAWHYSVHVPKGKLLWQQHYGNLLRTTKERNVLWMRERLPILWGIFRSYGEVHWLLQQWAHPGKNKMDATRKVQVGIHGLSLDHKSMCPGNWVPIKMQFLFCSEICRQSSE